jgi:DNA (cytosine-5)-methyltransferase 1
MKALDLFSGAGGMSLGAKLAGIIVSNSVETDPYAAATYKHNFPDANVFCGDVREFNTSTLDYQPDIVFGGPPCQGFSTSNQKTRSATNPINWLFKEFLRIVNEIEPNWVVIENVKGLIETEGHFFLKAILNGFQYLGYNTNFQVLNAVDYGIPQRRSRLFIVGSKKSKKFSFPIGDPATTYTVEEAIGDLPILPNGAKISFREYKTNQFSKYVSQLRNGQSGCENHLVTMNASHILERYKHIPQGGNWQNIPEHLMENYQDRTRCHTGIYHRLQADKPSVVIGNYRKNMLIHPTQNRGLSVREAARIQSFPDSFVFQGSIGFQQQQVGNAVPPLLAKSLFENIVASS